MKEVFVLQPMLKKKFSWSLKICLHFPRIRFERRGAKQTKKGGFEKLGESGFLGKGGIMDPPEVVSGIGRGGSEITSG
jgi:hypothetical protein